MSPLGLRSIIVAVLQSGPDLLVLGKRVTAA